MTNPFLILASSSPSRLKLIQQIGIVPDQIMSPDIDETAFRDELPKKYVERMALSKAEEILKKIQNDDSFKNNLSHSIILAADTIAVMGRRIFQKPSSRQNCVEMLEKFSGRRSRVYTTVVVKNHLRTCHRTVITTLNIKRLTSNDIEKYLNANQWQGCAGGFSLEEQAGAFVKTINGSFSNVIGLPLYETANLLKSFKIESK